MVYTYYGEPFTIAMSKKKVLKVSYYMYYVLSALRRFISRCGRVTNSHNYNQASNFISTSRELLTFTSEYTIKWHYIPLSSPCGRVWGSIIRSFKTYLFRVVAYRSMIFEELLILCCIKSNNALILDPLFH